MGEGILSYCVLILPRPIMLFLKQCTSYMHLFYVQVTDEGQ